MPPTGAWGASYGARAKVDIKSFHPNVKASKSVERFQRYSQLKIEFLCKDYKTSGGFTPWTLIKVPKLYLVGTT